MNRTHQPSKPDLPHDELHAFERRLGARPIIKEQQRARHNLSGEEEKRHAAEVVPDRVPMQRYFLLLGQFDKRLQTQPRIEPCPKRPELRGAHVQAFVTMMSSPFILTVYCSRGRGGGPLILLPFRS